MHMSRQYKELQVRHLVTVRTYEKDRVKTMKLEEQMREMHCLFKINEAQRR